jgi:hypothetical protein
MSTNPTECGSINPQICEFKVTERGPDSGTMVGTLPCNPPSIVAVDGNADLSSIITGEGGACVKTFVQQPHSGPARNAQVYVYGQGPQGSGSLKLDFWTANGHHDLTISSADPDCHNDIYSDGAPITTIKWTFNS